MGTSTSHPSPNRPTWNSVRRTLGDQFVPPDRVVNELWTVALRDTDAPISDQMSSPIVYELALLSQRSSSCEEAVRAATRAIVKSKASSILVELAKRALMSSFQASEDRVQAFAGGFFAEVAAYLSSRDIPGLLGMSERLRTVSSTIDFKAELKALTRKEASRVRASLESPQHWKEYVASVTHSLTGGRA